MCHVNHVLFKNIAVVQKQRSCQRKEHGLHIYELLCFMFTFSRVGEVLQELTNYSAVTLLGFRRRRCRCVSGGNFVWHSFTKFSTKRSNSREDGDTCVCQGEINPLMKSIDSQKPSSIHALKCSIVFYLALHHN